MGLRCMLLWGCALLASGCRPPELLVPEVRSPVEVRGVSAFFPADGRGRFDLELEVADVRSPGQLTRVDWEIWLAGRWFAAGVKPLEQPLSVGGPTRVQLDLPVAFDQKVIPGRTTLDLGVRGHLEAFLGQEERRWRFQRRLDVPSSSAPRLGPLGMRSREE